MCVHLMTFVGGRGGRSGGRSRSSSHSGGGILRHSGSGIDEGEKFFYKGPATGGGGLRSLRIKRPPVVKPAVCGGVGPWSGSGA